MKLELKHLAAYLPYKLDVVRTCNNEVMRLYGLSGDNTIEAVDKSTLKGEMHCALLSFGEDEQIPDEEFKPILRPLSDLTKEDWLQVFNSGFANAKQPLTDEFLNCERFIEFHDTMVEVVVVSHTSFYFEFDNCAFNSSGYRFNHKEALNELYKLHADLDRLIPAGLAISIHDTKLK